MKRLLLQTNISKVYSIVLLAITVFIIGCYFSYAMFTVNKEKKNAISIVTGNLTGVLKVDGEVTNQLVIPSGGSKKLFVVELSNTNNRKARYNFYYQPSPDVTINYIASTEYNVPPSASGVNLEAAGTVGSQHRYWIMAQSASGSEVTIHLGYQVGLDYNDLSLPSGTQLFEKANLMNFQDYLRSKQLNYTNIRDYAAGDRSKMYAFDQTAAPQQASWTSGDLVEYRYIGECSYNYITFNHEKWRIIGISTVEDESEKKEQRIKIVRNESIDVVPPLGFPPSWNNVKYENDDGQNKWVGGRLMKVLNPGYESDPDGGSYYWNRTSGNCYLSSLDTEIVPCDFTTTGLTAGSRNAIANTKWYLGGSPTPYSTTEQFYQEERGFSVYESASYPRETSWIGKVGLLYPSDVGFTYAYGYNPTCYGSISLCTARPYSWIYLHNRWWWSMATSISSADRVYAFYDSGIDEISAKGSAGLLPTVYLRKELKYVMGDGGHDNPFIITDDGIQYE